MHVQRNSHTNSNNNSEKRNNRVDGYNPRTEGFDPKKFRLPSDNFTPKPLPHVDRKQDGVQLSHEAQDLAAVDPAVCKNDWRCLEQLDLRGLLATG